LIKNWLSKSLKSSIDLGSKAKKLALFDLPAELTIPDGAFFVHSRKPKGLAVNTLLLIFRYREKCKNSHIIPLRGILEKHS
jgi:hypothetical protein